MILESLKSLIGADSFIPYSDEFMGKKIGIENFGKIGPALPLKAAFIDGGCSIIADGGSWSISKIKTSCICYNGKKRLWEKTREYYLIIAKKERYEIAYIDGKKLFELKIFGAEKFEIDELPAKIMKYFEFLEAKKIDDDSIIVMDSAIMPENDIEKDIINGLIESKAKIIGFCKTSRMRSKNGRSVLGLINSISPKGDWRYWPIFENEGRIKAFAAKLNSYSKFCYKIEIPSYLNHDECLSMLKFYSSDSEMPGYPYPLYKADKLARVNAFERKKDLFMAESALKGSGLEFDCLSSSFHSKMDERMYK